MKLSKSSKSFESQVKALQDEWKSWSKSTNVRQVNNIAPWPNNPPKLTLLTPITYMLCRKKWIVECVPPTKPQTVLSKADYHTKTRNGQTMMTVICVHSNRVLVFRGLGMFWVVNAFTHISMRLRTCRSSFSAATSTAWRGARARWICSFVLAVGFGCRCWGWWCGASCHCAFSLRTKMNSRLIDRAGEKQFRESNNNQLNLGNHRQVVGV